MEPEGSLSQSQASATCLYPGPAQSCPCTHIPPPGDPSQYYSRYLFSYLFACRAVFPLEITPPRPTPGDPIGVVVDLWIASSPE